MSQGTAPITPGLEAAGPRCSVACPGTHTGVQVPESHAWQGGERGRSREKAAPGREVAENQPWAQLSLFCSHTHSPVPQPRQQTVNPILGVEDRKENRAFPGGWVSLLPYPARSCHCWSHAPGCRLSQAVPPSTEDAGWADDSGMVWQPQKPPLASRRRGNWHRRPQEQEMSGRRACGAGSCSVSSALSGNRLPNYRAVPTALSSCRLSCSPLPSVLTVSPGLGHLLPLLEGTRQLPTERPALILPPQPSLAHRGAVGRPHPLGPRYLQVTVQAAPRPRLPPLLGTPSGRELR